MNNNVTPERKQNVLKTLAIIGLIGVVIIIAWLSVQIISIFPSAVTSLASLADSVYSYDPKESKSIKLEPVSQSIQTGDILTLNWDRPLQTGFYAFNFECQEGVSVEIKTTASEFQNASCDSSYNLGSVETAQVLIKSEKKPELQVKYTLSYYKTNSPTPTIEEKQSVTVINYRLATGIVPNPITVNDQPITTTPLENATVTSTTTPIKPVETPVEPVKPTPVESVKVPVTPATPKPTTPTYEYVYTIPVSNPKGFTDLEVSYQAIGRTNSAGSFINTGFLYKDVAGAVQFSVKNIGTKTSDEWYFSANLPGGVTYKSPKQLALKPNERVTLTIAFGAVSSMNLQTLSLEIETKNDTNSKNDSIKWTTVVLR